MNRTSANPPRILLVEPHKGALAVIAKRLTEAGYRVVACAAPGDAMAELRRAPVDLLISETRMKRVSGIEIVRLLRDDSMTRDLPVILIAGRSDATGAIDAFEAGADDVVAKPFDFDVLQARVARALRRAGAVRALRADNATLDARVVERAIELGETRAALEYSEAERKRLEQMVGRA